MVGGIEKDRIHDLGWFRVIKIAEKLDPKELVSFEELLMSNVIEQEALVNLLEKKGNHNQG